MIQRGPHRCYVQNRPVLQWRNSKILGGNEEKKKTLVFFFFYLGMVWASWVALNSVARLCPTFCSPMDCSTPGFPVHHQLPELMSTESMMPSNHLTFCFIIPFSSCLQSFPASGSFLMNQFLTSGGQSIGVSAPVSVLPVNAQG